MSPPPSLILLSSAPSSVWRLALSNASPVITIDGPSGSGKGTIASRLANLLGFTLLDSGALYRVLGLAADREGLAPGSDSETIAALARRVEIGFGKPNVDSPWVEGSVWLGSDDVSLAIRTDEASAMASQVAAIPAVRAALLQRQRDFLGANGLVADGRDMGTTVFPDAALKVFLTASVEARADRRYKQLIGKGIDAILPALLSELEERDARDTQRSASPLKPAVDAVIIDSTMMSIEQVMAQITDLAREKLDR
jgi:cytidylate kinase